MGSGCQGTGKGGNEVQGPAGEGFVWRGGGKGTGRAGIGGVKVSCRD